MKKLLPVPALVLLLGSAAAAHAQDIQSEYRDFVMKRIYCETSRSVANCSDAMRRIDAVYARARDTRDGHQLFHEWAKTRELLASSLLLKDDEDFERLTPREPRRAIELLRDTQAAIVEHDREGDRPHAMSQHMIVSEMLVEALLQEVGVDAARNAVLERRLATRDTLERLRHMPQTDTTRGAALGLLQAVAQADARWAARLGARAADHDSWGERDPVASRAVIQAHREAMTWWAEDAPHGYGALPAARHQRLAIDTASGLAITREQAWLSQYRDAIVSATATIANADALAALGRDSGSGLQQRLRSLHVLALLALAEAQAGDGRTTEARATFARAEALLPSARMPEPASHDLRLAAWFAHTRARRFGGDWAAAERAWRQLADSERLSGHEVRLEAKAQRRNRR